MKIKCRLGPTAALFLPLLLTVFWAFRQGQAREPTAPHGQPPIKLVAWEKPEPEGDTVPHKPPALKPVRWQKLDPCYGDVFIDADGRAWFFCPVPRGWGKIPQWAYLVCPELPDKTIQMPGTNVPLGFDGRNRFWEVGKSGLCSTDVGNGKFLQRRPSDPAKGLSDWTSRRDSPLPFVPLMFEHSSGRLYFFDAEGVHILDGETWSYHKLLSDEKVVHSRVRRFFACESAKARTGRSMSGSAAAVCGCRTARNGNSTPRRTIRPWPRRKKFSPKRMARSISACSAARKSR